MRRLLPALAALMLLAGPSLADKHPGFKDLWVKVASDPSCTKAEYADFFLFTCDGEMTMWYFTKPNHPAFPGVIQRSVKEGRDGVYADEQGTSFASDDAQPQFKAWLAQIQDLDRQAREYMKQKSQSDAEKH